MEIAQHLASAPSKLPTEGPLAIEIELLKQVVIDGIVTTNFDPLLESFFPDFRVFVGQEELLFAGLQGVGEIYKIHGSTSDPDSLVLTSRDYQRFEDRNPYLAAKLLTTFVEHPVIFLGYSLTDSNVTSILSSIAGCLTQSNIDQLRDQLIFVQWNPEVEPSTAPYTLVVDGFTIMVHRIVVQDLVKSSRPYPNFVDLFQPRFCAD